MAHPHPPLRLHLHRFTIIAALVVVALLAFAGGISGFGAIRWKRSSSSSEVTDIPDISTPSSSSSSNCEEENGTRWAIVIAGSSGFGNYRHQVSPSFSDFVTLKAFFLSHCLIIVCNRSSSSVMELFLFL